MRETVYVLLGNDNRLYPVEFKDGIPKWAAAFATKQHAEAVCVRHNSDDSGMPEKRLACAAIDDAIATARTYGMAHKPAVREAVLFLTADGSSWGDSRMVWSFMAGLSPVALAENAQIPKSNLSGVEFFSRLSEHSATSGVVTGCRCRELRSAHERYQADLFSEADQFREMATNAHSEEERCTAAAKACAKDKDQTAASVLRAAAKDAGAAEKSALDVLKDIRGGIAHLQRVRVPTGCRSCFEAVS